MYKLTLKIAREYVERGKQAIGKTLLSSNFRRE
jgi:hypothetical protein